MAHTLPDIGRRCWLYMLVLLLKIWIICSVSCRISGSCGTGGGSSGSPTEGDHQIGW